MAALSTWKLKALAQKVLWRLPSGERLNAMLAMLRQGHNPQHDLNEQHARNWFRHISVLHETNLLKGLPKSALEIGTGWDLDVALLMSLSGVHTVTTVDILRHVRFGKVHRHLALFEPLLSQIAAVGARDPEETRREWQNLLHAGSLDELCRIARIRYFAPVSSNYDEIPDNSLDLCYSTAVFEHIRSDDIRKILETTRRKLRPDGLSTHVIDIKDHFAYFQRTLPYNHFLRFSEKEWMWWADNPMSYLNRLSPSAWQQIFLDTGYSILHFETIHERTLKPMPLHLLHEEQRNRTESDLSIGELHIVARPL